MQTWRRVLPSNRLSYTRQRRTAARRRRRTTMTRDRWTPKEYAAIEAADRSLLDRAEQAIDAGDVGTALDLLDAVQVSTVRRDRLFIRLTRLPDAGTLSRSRPSDRWPW